MFGKVYPLNSYRQRRKPKEYVSLLEAKSGDIARLKEQHAEVAKAPVEVVSYWRPNMTVQVGIRSVRKILIEYLKIVGSCVCGVQNLGREVLRMRA